MTDTTLDAARRCPKCEQPGVEENRRHMRGGGMSITFGCHNERCRWYGQPGWVVDVRPDGTLPDPDRHRSKAFPKMPDFTDRMRETVDKQLERELGPGGAEVQRRM